MKYKYRYINSRHATFVGVFILEKPQTKCMHWDWDPTGQKKKVTRFLLSSMIEQFVKA